MLLFAQNNILDVVDVVAPPFVRGSHGLWIDVPRAALDILASKNLHEGASVHAAAHALMSLTPIVAMSVQGDVKTECRMPEKELSVAALEGEGRKRPSRCVPLCALDERETDAPTVFLAFFFFSRKGSYCTTRRASREGSVRRRSTT